jgi:hypothetical protein
VFKSTRTMADLEHVSRWRERELATPEEQAAAAAHAKAVADEERAGEALRADADRELQPRWRRELAQYLLAGTFAARRVLMVEAEEFSRGNLAIDREKWGSAEFGIVHTKEPGAQFAEYDLTFVSGGRQALEVRYASDEARPMRVLWNGKLVAERALGADTESFYLGGQIWERVAVLDVEPGRKRAAPRATRALPHLERLVLAPVSPGPRPTGARGHPWAAGLEPLAVRAARVLERTSARPRGDPCSDCGTRSRASPRRFRGARAELAAQLRGERDAGTLTLAPPIARCSTACRRRRCASSRAATSVCSRRSTALAALQAPEARQAQRALATRDRRSCASAVRPTAARSRCARRARNRSIRRRRGRSSRRGARRSTRSRSPRPSRSIARSRCRTARSSTCRCTCAAATSTSGPSRCRAARSRSRRVSRAAGDARRGERAPRARALDRRSAQSADGARDGQSALAGPLRRGTRPHAVELRPARRVAEPSRAARRLAREFAERAGRSRTCTA